MARGCAHCWVWLPRHRGRRYKWFRKCSDCWDQSNRWSSQNIVERHTNIGASPSYIGVQHRGRRASARRSQETRVLDVSLIADYRAAIAKRSMRAQILICPGPNAELERIGIVNIPARFPIELPGVGILLLQAMIQERPWGAPIVGCGYYAIGVVSRRFAKVLGLLGSIKSMVEPKYRRAAH